MVVKMDKSHNCVTSLASGSVTHSLQHNLDNKDGTKYNVRCVQTRVSFPAGTSMTMIRQLTPTKVVLC